MTDWNGPRAHGASVARAGGTGVFDKLQPGGGRHRPARQDRRQVLPVVGLGVEVVAGLGALGGVRGGRGDRLGCRVRTGERG